MTISPDKWGVHGWKFIHHVALGYPNLPSNNDKKNYKNFFMIIGNVLPCNICNEHYNAHLLIYPLTDTVLSKKINLINWTIDMHNAVNKINKKKIYGYTEALEIIRNNYENNYKISPIIKNSLPNNLSINNNSSINNKKNTNLYLYVIIVILVFLLFISLMCNKRLN